MSIRSIHPFLFAFLLVCTGLVARASGRDGPPDHGQPAFFQAAEHLRDTEDRLRREWQIEALESALQNGFLSVASTLAQRLLEDPRSEREREQVLNLALRVALMRGQMQTAADLAARLRESGLEIDPLMEAFRQFFSGNSEAAQLIIRELDPMELSPPDRSWLLLLQALQLAREGSVEAANRAFLRAERAAPSRLLQRHFEVVRIREELRVGTVDDDSVSALRESVRSMRGERAGFEAARLLAIALNQRGESSEAIEVINAHLAAPGVRELNFRPAFLLLMGIIAGPESNRGQLALRQLITEASEGLELDVAFSLLVQTVDSLDGIAALLRDIQLWLETPGTHPLEERLLAHKAYLHLSKGELNEAEASASRLLEVFPESAFTPAALRLLAHVSWNHIPPRYRTAADYLSQLRQYLPAGAESLQVSLSIADCYFLNEDYSSAANAYGSVQADGSAALVPRAFFQRVLAELGAGRPDEAGRQINAAYGNPGIPLDVIWQAEWNLIDRLRRSDAISAALERAEALLGPDSEAESLPPELQLRIHWVAARLNLEAGFAEQAEARARELLEALESPLYAALSDPLRQDIEAHLLLLIGESLVAQTARDAALQLFGRLRERFPQSGPAILSYLVESRSESDADNLVSAQQSLISLVDRFPHSEYAPIALWEAALNAEQRGLVIHLQEAISILERLVTDYSAHPLVYFARLKQGDLARRLNDFPTALLIYENLLTQYPDHPQRYRAEISRADCLMALGADSPARVDAATVAYERIALLSNAPGAMKMEAGFKWGHALEQQGDSAGAEAVLWLMYERFVLDPDRISQLLAEGTGRYWTARSLLELAARQVDKGEIVLAEQFYRHIAALGLPGVALANSRLEALQ